MTHLIIRNIGSLQSVDIYLNKMNVIIGPQGSGKSTINRIACYHTWIEKKVLWANLSKYFSRKTYVKPNSFGFTY